MFRGANPGTSSLSFTRIGQRKTVKAQGPAAGRQSMKELPRPSGGTLGSGPVMPRRSSVAGVYVKLRQIRVAGDRQKS